jgi:GcrA cell cycle regulator
MAWTVERVAFIRAQYLDARKSAGEIAALLGDVTREAVCGKLYRIGARRQGPPVRQKKVRRLETHANSKPRPNSRWHGGPVSPSRHLEETLAEKAIPFLDAQPAHCRWITGKHGGGFYVCGHLKSRGAFCGHHAAIAYQARRPRSVLKSLRPDDE